MSRNEYPIRTEWPEPEHVTVWQFVGAVVAAIAILAAIWLWAIVLLAAS